MFVKVRSIAFVGINPIELDVEVNVTNRGLPGFDIVGLPSKSVEESRQRVKNAVINSGFEFPNKKITVNLAPADIHKEGSCYDLPIAVGIYCAANNISIPPDLLFYGELSMDGYLRYTKRVFVSLLYCLDIKNSRIVIPLENYSESHLVENEPSKCCMYFTYLKDVFSYLNTRSYTEVSTLAYKTSVKTCVTPQNNFPNIDEIIGNSMAKRALLIAAAGYHNILIVGPPGTGKSMLAKSVVSLLPRLSKDKAIETTKIYSYAGKLNSGENLIEVPPFRSPHHASSSAAILGGGPYAQPGEVTFAHNGVLFLDELCEFKRDVLECLRQPLQEGRISINRRGLLVEYPCDFMLVGATNPCPCGYYNDPEKQCTCLPNKISLYKNKLSGPLLDRIDLQVNVFRENFPVPSNNEGAKNYGNYFSLEQLQQRIAAARVIQTQRFKDLQWSLNSKVSSTFIQNSAWLEPSAQSFLDNAYSKMHLSLRAYFKVIRVSRTIADLDSSVYIKTVHIAEALQYRGQV